ncbi:MAG: DNA/RNA non-specific endonuclease [Bdellovibrionales bacterium]|nr:DNA/RNA non-specific endonuclease [Bdellovibrionales bacterium]
MMLNILAWLLFPLLALASPLAQSPLDEQVIDRDNYSLSYNESHEVANWVAYPLGHAQIRGCVSRTDSFRIDPLITNGSATLEDYKNSNFDRGHLLPAGDMKFDKQAMKDTFYMSNMTPQPAKFNRGRWSMLENLMRSWALKYENIWIVTGPVLVDKLPTIGANKVSIPVEYFKVILRKEGNTYKGIGFLMSVDVPYPDLVTYALSINQIEDLSGVDFFPFLSDSIEEEVESDSEVEKWDFKAKFNYLPCVI